MRRSVSLLSLTLAASLLSAGCESETSTTPQDKAAVGAENAPAAGPAAGANTGKSKAKPITERRKFADAPKPKSL